MFKYKHTNISSALKCLEHYSSTVKQLRDVWKQAQAADVEYGGYLIDGFVYHCFIGGTGSVHSRDWQSLPEHFHTHPCRPVEGAVSYVEKYSPPSGEDFRAVASSGAYVNREHICCEKGIWIIRATMCISDIAILDAVCVYWQIVKMLFSTWYYGVPKKRRGGLKRRRADAIRREQAIMCYMRDVCVVNSRLLEFDNEWLNGQLARNGYQEVAYYKDVICKLHGCNFVEIQFVEY